MSPILKLVEELEQKYNVSTNLSVLQEPEIACRILAPYSQYTKSLHTDESHFIAGKGLEKKVDQQT